MSDEQSETPPISLEEATGRAEACAEELVQAVQAMRRATDAGQDRAAWSALQQALDTSGDFMGLAANALMTIVPREYFPRGWSDLFDVPGDGADGDPEVISSRYEFDPHDYTSRENIRFAIHACAEGGDFDPAGFAFMFAPPDPLSKIIDDEEQREKASQRMAKTFWNECEGKSAGEIKLERDAAAEALELHSADFIEYATSERDEPGSMLSLYVAAWRARTYGFALQWGYALTLGRDGLPPWDKLSKEKQDALQFESAFEEVKHHMIEVAKSDPDVSDVTNFLQRVDAARPRAKGTTRRYWNDNKEDFIEWLGYPLPFNGTDEEFNKFLSDLKAM